MQVTRLTECETAHSSDKVVNGWELAIYDCDLRDFENDLFSAHQVSDNQILIKEPSVTPSFLKENTFAVLDDSISRAHGMTRSAIVGDKKGMTARASKYMLLTFPDDEVLEAEPFFTQVIRPEDKDGELKVDFEPYDMEFNLESGAKNHASGLEKHYMNTGKVAWYVAIKGTERRVALAKAKKLTPAEQLAAKLARTSISTPAAP